MSDLELKLKENQTRALNSIAIMNHIMKYLIISASSEIHMHAIDNHLKCFSVDSELLTQNNLLKLNFCEHENFNNLTKGCLKKNEKSLEIVF